MRLKYALLSWIFGVITTTTAVAAEGGEWLIRTTGEQPTAAALSARLGVAIERIEPVANDLYLVVAASSVDLKALVTELEDDSILRVQRNFVYRPFLETPKQAAAFADSTATEAVDNPAVQPPDENPDRGADPQLGKQWGLDNAQVYKAWSVQRGSPDVIVAVIDTGVDYNHEDLRANMWRNPGEIPDNGIDDDGNGYIDDVVGWDFVDNDSLPYDKMSAARIDGNPGHGTHCAGVVGAVGENGRGISGVAPGVKIMGLRFISDKGQGTTADAVRAIRYAVANGARILSNSWGSEGADEDDEELKQAIQEAQDAGALLIFAAGNGRNGTGYNNDTDARPALPASYDFDAIVSVAASDNNDRLGGFSNFGIETVDLAAPGVRVLSTVPENNYEDQIRFFGFPVADWSGTSMATPHVAGAAALVWSQYPELSALEVKARLLDSVRPVEGLREKVKTGGVLNVGAALEWSLLMIFAHDHR